MITDAEAADDPVERALAGDMAFAAEAARILRAKADFYMRFADRQPDFGDGKVSDFFRQSAKVASSMSRVMSEWVQAVPPNWPENRLREGIEFVVRTRLPIIWIPRRDIVAALLDAPASNLHIDLAQNGELIVEDCQTALSRVRTDRYDDVLPFVREALSSFKAGYAASAQALAASLLTTLLQHHVGYNALKDARDLGDIGPDEAAFDTLRLALLGQCVPVALADFWENRGDAVPSTFNRHASLHRVCVEQYTDANALVSIMLVSGFICELDELESSGRWP